MESGDCSVEKTVIALNLNGGTVTDAWGVTHQSDSSVTPEDDFGISRPYDIRSVSEDPIFNTGIQAASEMRETGRCLTYKISICEDGLYEFSVKTIEIANVLEGEKVFVFAFVLISSYATSILMEFLT